MTDFESEKDKRFVERIATPLRASERLRDSFEARVMLAAHDAVREEASADSVVSLAWWRRPRTITVSPVRAMAMAAGLVAAIVLGNAGYGALVGDRPADPSVVAASTVKVDTVHVVRFVLSGTEAESIALVGDFNDWSRNATHLQRTPDGKAWTVSLSLPPGRHEYAFLVRDADGERWVADPFATTRHDEFGTLSSLVHVGTDAPRSTSSS